MEHPQVIIVGGGIAGLSTAWYLQQQAQVAGRQLDITIVESHQQVGGKVTTDYIDLPDAATPLVVEGGPDSFITQKPWAMQLCQELGLEGQFMSTQPARYKVLVLHKGRPVPLPDGIVLVVPTDWRAFLRSPLISWPGKLRMALDLVLPRRRDDSDESLAAFIKRRLGAEALDKIAEPLMAGIYNAESARQSLLATFPRLRVVEEQYGSLIRGMRMVRTKAAPTNQPTSPFISLRGGMRTLIDALAPRLSATIITGRSVVALQPPGPAQPRYQLALDSGQQLQADAVVLAAPSSVAAQLIQPWDADLALGLRQIRYVSTGTVSLAFPRSALQVPWDGYGLIIPTSERRQINAVTVSSRKFAHRAPDDIALVRVFFGGSRHPEMMAHDDAALLEIVRAELRSIFGLSADPLWHGIYRWHNANPQYDVGHLSRLERLERACPPGLWLCGSSYRGVGLPDCIHQAQQTAATLFAFLQQAQPAALERA